MITKIVKNNQLGKDY